jgi:hypothetical protein
MFHSKGSDSIKLAYEIQNGFVQGLSALTVTQKVNRSFESSNKSDLILLPLLIATRLNVSENW